jgi:hypothetical protein
MHSAYGISGGNKAAQNPFTNLEEEATVAAPAAARKSRLVIRESAAMWICSIMRRTGGQLIFQAT